MTDDGLVTAVTDAAAGNADGASHVTNPMQENLSRLEAMMRDSQHELDQMGLGGSAHGIAAN